MRFDDESDLENVPTVRDFSVELADPTDEGGRHIQYVSAGKGRLAGFPAWDHADRDLRHFVASDVPLGAIDEPYADEDEGWRIVIFEHGGYVYVLEGRSPLTEDFAVAFKVPREQYLAAWAFVIDAFNPITPLDDTKEA